MAVTVLRYRPQGDLAEAIDSTVSAAGLNSRTIRLWTHEPPPEDLTGIDGLVLLGSTGPAVDSDSLALTASIALLRSALHAEVPVLAAGDAARVLAMAAGLAERTQHGGRGGCGATTLTPAADADPLLAGVAPPASGLQSTPGFGGLPRKAVALLSCDLHPAHAFRIGGSAWGMDFQLGHESGLTAWWEGVIDRFAALVSARAEHTATRAFFTCRADAWEERFAYQTPAYAAAVARMHLRPGGRVVDLGCGTGRAMPALRTQVGDTGSVLGIDVTPAMLAAAGRHGRSRYGNLLAADCTRLPLPAASVDGIFSAGLLDHLPDPRTALREWARVSAPDGTLLLFHPSGRAERAARHGRALDPGDLLAKPNLRPALETTGWVLAEYEDAAGHFLARATRTIQPTRVHS
ncbi:methyltransferase domain-containing protein [Streptomyces sp. NPDC127110]|uniref:methyltransferase domain-containing protein n=1 Tax=Streptomyces sp. NPDC127110 TaxID=3345362 RepID=UPI003639CFA2